jgi:hypothetical protein
MATIANMKGIETMNVKQTTRGESALSPLLRQAVYLTAIIDLIERWS